MKDSTRTWDISKKAMETYNSKNENKIESMLINDQLTTDLSKIADGFTAVKTFPTPSTPRQLNPFCPTKPHPSNLQLGHTSPATLVNIIKFFKPKQVLTTMV